MRGDQQAQQRVGCQRLQDGVQLRKGKEERNRKNVLRQRKDRKIMKNENLASKRY